MFFRSLIAISVVMVLTTGFMYFGSLPTDADSSVEKVKIKIDTPTTTLTKPSSKPSIKTPAKTLAVMPAVSADKAPIKTSPAKTSIETMDKDVEPKPVNSDVKKTVKPKNTGWTDLTRTTEPLNVTSMTPKPKSRSGVGISRSIVKKKSLGQQLNEEFLVAQDLKTPDLQDDAFLGLIDKAVNGEAYNRGLNMAEYLSTPERRDAARLRVMTGLISGGQVQRGYGIYFKLELDATKERLEQEMIATASDIQSELSK